MFKNRVETRVKRQRGQKKSYDKGWDEIDLCYKAGLEIRRPFEQYWILNLAFLMGKQNTFFNSAAHMLQKAISIKKSDKIDNILLPKWRRQVSDMVKEEPMLSVIPDSTEEEDIRAAKLGTSFLEHFWRVAKMREKWLVLAGWKYAVGGCFLDSQWKTDAGPITIDEKGNVVYAGEVEIGIWNYFEVLFPATGLSYSPIDSFPWIEKVKWRTLDYIKENYPKQGERVMAEAANNPYVNLTAILNPSRGRDELSEGAFVKELYIKPNSKYPKGAVLTGANGVLLRRQEFPYSSYFLHHFKDITFPGVFWGTPTMQVAVPLQVRWNTTLNDIEEFNTEMGKGKILAPEKAGLKRKFNQEHGEVITYKPVMGLKPEQLTLKGLPATYKVILDATTFSVENIFSQHEVSRGTNRSDIRSGNMTALLLEQDALASVPTAVNDRESLSALFAQVLRRVQKGYTDERFIKIIGRDQDYELKAFKGADLRNNWDVTVGVQRSLSDSRVMREAQILDRYEKALYGDPADPEVKRHVMNMLDDAVVKDIFAHTRLDESIARYENETIIQGIEVIVNHYDNHKLHKQEHDRFRKKLDYQKIKMTNPTQFIQLESFFLNHQMQHDQYIAEEFQMLVEQQKLMEGAKK